jgi:hypothetical protein
VKLLRCDEKPVTAVMSDMQALNAQHCNKGRQQQQQQRHTNAAGGDKSRADKRCAEKPVTAVMSDMQAVKAHHCNMGAAGTAAAAAAAAAHVHAADGHQKTRKSYSIGLRACD